MCRMAMDSSLLNGNKKHGDQKWMSFVIEISHTPAGSTDVETTVLMSNCMDERHLYSRKVKIYMWHVAGTLGWNPPWFELCCVPGVRGLGFFQCLPCLSRFFLPFEIHGSLWVIPCFLVKEGAKSIILISSAELPYLKNQSFIKLLAKKQFP